MTRNQRQRLIRLRRIRQRLADHLWSRAATLAVWSAEHYLRRHPV